MNHSASPDKPRTLMDIATSYGAEDAMRRQHAAVDAQPVSPVEVALGQIDAGLRDLRETVQRLSLQLAPVLSPISSVSQKGQPDGPVPAAQAPLVDCVDALAAQLRQDCAALQDLERRLAL